MKIRSWIFWLLSLPLLIVAVFAPVITNNWDGTSFDLPGWGTVAALATMTFLSLVIGAFTPETALMVGWCCVLPGLLLTPLLLFTRLRRVARRLHAVLSGALFLLFVAVPILGHYFWPGEVSLRFGFSVFIAALACQCLALAINVMESFTVELHD